MDLSVRKRISHKHAILTIVLACFFWYLTFGLELFNFWYSMAIAATVLAVLAMIWGGRPFTKKDITLKNIAVGIVSSAILYAVFWCGNFLAGIIFGFAPEQVQSIYGIRNQAQLWVIIGILLFVTSPAEEIFWRGFLQRWLEQHVGLHYGWIVAAFIYGGVHIFSGNFMLVMAALTAGFFWGLIYVWLQSTVPIIISHSLWTVAVFVLFPIV